MMTNFLTNFRESLTLFFESHGIKLTKYAIKFSNGDSNYDISVHLPSSVSSFDDRILNELKYKQWYLPIAEVTIQGNRCNIILDRQKTITNVMRQVHKELFDTFGTISDKALSLSYDFHSSTEDLTNYRIALLVQIVKNLCQTVGYSFSKGDVKLHFTNKTNLKESEKPGRKIILCGAVLNSHLKAKETEVSVTSYRNLQKVTILQQAEHRVTQEIVSSLTDAVLNFNLLRVKVNSPVILDVKNTSSSSAGTVVFILYNYARLNAILHEYETRVLRKHYPALPAINSINFSLLKEKKEWKIVFCFILEFSATVRRTIENIDEGRLSLHLLAQFLYSLARTTSSYYRSTKILLEAESQLPLLFARLYLIKIVHKILSNGLGLLNIPVIPAL